MLRKTAFLTKILEWKKRTVFKKLLFQKKTVFINNIAPRSSVQFLFTGYL
jgi:hypothetical protein